MSSAISSRNNEEKVFQVGRGCSELFRSLNFLMIPIPVPHAHVRIQRRIRAMGQYLISRIYSPLVLILECSSPGTLHLRGCGPLDLAAWFCALRMFRGGKLFPNLRYNSRFGLLGRRGRPVLSEASEEWRQMRQAGTYDTNIYFDSPATR